MVRETQCSPLNEDEDGDDRNWTTTNPFGPVATDDDPDERDILNVLADLGGVKDVYVNVHRIVTGKGNEYVGRFEPGSFSLDVLKDNYGAGQYSIQVRADGKIRGRRTVHIAEPKTPLALPAPKQDTDGLEKLTAGMLAGFQQLQTVFMEGLKTLAHNQQPQKSLVEQAQELAVLRDLFSPQQPQQSFSELFGLFQQGVQFAKDQTPRESDPGTGEIMLTALKELGPLFQKAQQAQVAAAPDPVPAPRRAAASAPGQPATPQQNPAEEQAAMFEQMYFRPLLAAAKADHDPGTYAEMALNMMGDEAAAELANRPDWFELVCARIPEAKDYQPWFEEMREGILMALEPPADLAPIESPSAADLTPAAVSAIPADETLTTVEPPQENATDKPAS